MLNIFRKQFEVATTAITPSHGQLITRDYTDASGQQFRLTFFVTIVDGEVRGKLVSVVRLETRDLRLEGSCSRGFCLPCASAFLQSPISNLESPALLVSPYTELYFFMSQPTRAPSRA